MVCETLAERVTYVRPDEACRHPTYLEAQLELMQLLQDTMLKFHLGYSSKHEGTRAPPPSEPEQHPEPETQPPSVDMVCAR